MAPRHFFGSLEEINPVRWRFSMMSTLSQMRYGEQKLANFEIFQGLPDEVVETYSKQCLWRRYDAHQTLIEHEDTSRNVFFISFGRARATHYAASGREISF